MDWFVNDRGTGLYLGPCLTLVPPSPEVAAALTAPKEPDPEMAAPEGGMAAEREGTAAAPEGIMAAEQEGEICPTEDVKAVQMGCVCVTLLEEPGGPKVTHPPAAV